MPRCSDEIEFPSPLFRRFDDLWAGLGGRFGFRLGFSLADGGDVPLPVDLLFGDPHRIVVEGRIGKEPRGGAGVVENVEPELAVVIPDAGPAPDDLLELAHRADDAREHDVLASRRIDAGREQLRCREDRRRTLVSTS